MPLQTSPHFAGPRIWNPFPLSVDVNSYPDADVGKFLFKGWGQRSHNVSQDMSQRDP